MLVMRPLLSVPQMLLFNGNEIPVFESHKIQVMKIKMKNFKKAKSRPKYLKNAFDTKKNLKPKQIV